MNKQSASRTIKNKTVLKTFDIDCEKFTGSIDIWTEIHNSTPYFNFSMEGKLHCRVGTVDFDQTYFVDRHAQADSYDECLQTLKELLRNRFGYDLLT